ncbi:MAG: DUF72 domain-containing protein [Candidatus Fermentibacteria bacterium]|nr:DUF72 domain-containing protein [Candidatus Fermentibacteria bacterium]
MDLFETKVEIERLPEGASFYPGTSGYSFPEWLNVFYPSRIARKDWLRYYALKFNSVEINSTYYRILSESSTGRMSDSVPDNFSFSVKLYSSMTHSRDATAENWAAFDRMLAPLISSGKMGIVLAQFPWSFPLEKKSFSYLRTLRDNLGSKMAAVEFRHEKWYSEDVMEQVREMGFTLVSTDLPVLPGLPETGLLTGEDTVYLRLHGRNAGKWWGNTQERYDYLYSEKELKTWADKLRSLSKDVKSCYVFFNNCHMGKAALNAADMQRLMVDKIESSSYYDG